MNFVEKHKKCFKSCKNMLATVQSTRSSFLVLNEFFSVSRKMSNKMLLFAMDFSSKLEVFALWTSHFFCLNKSLANIIFSKIFSSGSGFYLFQSFTWILIRLSHLFRQYIYFFNFCQLLAQKKNVFIRDIHIIFRSHLN